MLNHVYIIFSSFPYFKTKDLLLLSIVKNNYINLLDYSDLRLTQILLFDGTSLDISTNSSILNATINFFISSKWLEEPLFQSANFFFSVITNFYQNLICILFPLYWYFLVHYICFIF